MEKFMREKICILMSTYNPNKYFLEQIKSIQNQSDVDVTLVIRDDGSKNKQYLNMIEKTNIKIILGENVGVTKSYHLLAKHVFNNCAYNSFNYFAFADQDDYWENDKLKTAINALRQYKNSEPSLYYSNLMICDEDLNPLRLQWKNIIKNSKGQYLTQVFSLGCTCVFNRACLKEYTYKDTPDYTHDCIILYICVFLGNVIYDSEPHILYRQHGNNVSGNRISVFQIWVKRFRNIKDLFVGPSEISDMSGYILNKYYKVLNEQDKNLLYLTAHYKERLRIKIKLLLNKEIKPGYFPKSIFVFLRILFNTH